MEIKYFVLKKRNLKATCATSIYRLVNNEFQYFNMYDQKWESHSHYPNDMDEVNSETHIVITKENEKIAKDLNKKMFYKEILK